MALQWGHIPLRERAASGNEVVLITEASAYVGIEGVSS